MREPSELILHPVRLRILRTLGLRQLTPRQLQAQLPDIAQATLYRQLKKLEAGHLIEIVEQQARRGTIEKTYRLKQSELTPAYLAEASPEQWKQLFQRFIAFLLMDFERYLSGPAQPLEDGVGFRQVLLHLSPEDRQSLARELHQVLAPYLARADAPHRQAMLFSTILMPDGPGAAEQA